MVTENSKKVFFETPYCKHTRYQNNLQLTSKLLYHHYNTSTKYSLQVNITGNVEC